MSKLLKIIDEARRARTAHVSGQKPLFPNLQVPIVIAFLFVGTPFFLLLSYLMMHGIAQDLHDGVATIGRRGTIEILRAKSPIIFYISIGMTGILSFLIAIAPFVFIYDAIKKRRKSF